MKKILNVLFALLMFTALAMFTGCPADDDGGGSGGDGSGDNGGGTGGGGEVSGDGSSINSPIILIANVWGDGNIPTSDGEQWFKFTATAENQYIHVNLGTLTDMYVQLYKSKENTVGSKTNLYNYKKSFNLTLNVGQVYYIKVTPFNNTRSGTYQIGFTDSATAPTKIPLPTNATQLTINTWGNGELITSDSEQWFKFTATADKVYIHADFVTLAPSLGINIQLYDNKSGYGDIVGDLVNLFGTTTGIYKYTSQISSPQHEYYIKVMSKGSSSGTYKIAFNTLPILPANATTLTAASTWNDSTFSELVKEQWFKFTATAENQYIHIRFGTMNELAIKVYDKDGIIVDTEKIIYSSDSRKYISRSLSINQEYYINITLTSFSNKNGTYSILFSTLPILPLNATPLTANTWVDGNIPTSNDLQWFKFTGTGNTDYIHVKLGTMTDINYQIYYSDGNEYGVEYSFSSSQLYTSRSTTANEIYYIRLRPPDGSSNSGTFKITFNSSSTPPATSP
jgi:hypothetical protein